MTNHIYTFLAPADSNYEAEDIEAQSYLEALVVLLGTDDGINVVRDYHGLEGAGGLDEVLRDGEPLRNFWSLGTGEVL